MMKISKRTIRSCALAGPAEVSIVIALGTLAEVVAVPGLEGGESKLLFVSPGGGTWLSIVKEDEEVPLFCGSDD